MYFVSGNQGHKGLRFTSNLKSRIILIPVKSLRSVLPIHVISDKIGEIPQMNVSYVRNNIRLEVHETCNFMYIYLT